ncbi:hypothetical protein GCM10011399_33280 [Subtercola lobariae]|uniref:N-acetyltransferase domain-containing protein n=2 Tax=Subtercola lobariae TaxID=1588641 RepID=A0A917BD13_9MICO|nr:hypothetical protein GCM10011399_33280 [Subtercola lobariae]
MTEFSVERIAIPQSLDGPDARDFVAGVEVRNASETRAYGTSEVSYPAAEMLPTWLDPHEPKALWVARAAGTVVGRAVHETQLDPSAPGGVSEVGWIDVDVHPNFEGRSIGTALATVVEQYARSLGQTRLVCYAVSPVARVAGGEQLRPPTGFGSVAAQNREVRFLLARGYRLEQVERASRFTLPADASRLAALRREAESASETKRGEVDTAADLSENSNRVAESAAGETKRHGADAATDSSVRSPYRVHTWAGPTPAEWLADLATLLTRMSTDAPTAGLDEPEDIWSAERVAASDARCAASTRDTLTAAIEHLPTGRLVAFSQLAVPNDRARPVSQEDTLVLREHRGHRLGLLVKVANLQFLEREHPGHPSVLTWNAEENRPMLDVNEALGFVLLGYEGAWRLDL